MVRRPTAKCVQNLEQVACAILRPNARNARKHGAKQIEHLKAIIGRVGFVQPVLIDQDNRLIAGHGRLEAAKQLAIETIPAIRLAHLNEAELRALALADNRIAELAEWDEEALKLELSELVLEDLEFSISDVTGFAPPQIDALVYGSDFGVDDDPADQLADPPNPEPISRLGDVWRADGLVLVCGDALEAGAYRAALGDEPAAMSLTDPPFNVPIGGHVSGLGKVRHREFVQGSGEMSSAEFIQFLTEACTRIKEHTSPAALVYLFMDGTHLYELLSAARASGLQQKAFITWAKTNAGMGAFYRSQTEHVVVFKSGQAAHTNNIQLGRYGRSRTTLWTYPGVNGFGRDRDAALAQHPTVKPVALLADAILDATRRGDLVLDPFAGSGSTLIAAHRTRRRAAGVDLDPLYVDGALARIERVTGLSFARDSDGARFAELVAEARP